MANKPAPDKEPSVHGLSVKQRIIADMNKAGYSNVSDYIDSLINKIKDLENSK